MFTFKRFTGVKTTKHLTPNTIIYHKPEHRFCLIKAFDQENQTYLVEKLYEQNYNPKNNFTFSQLPAKQVEDITVFHICNAEIIPIINESVMFKKTPFSRIMLEKSRSIIIDNNLLNEKSRLSDVNDTLIILTTKPYFQFRNKNTKQHFLEHFNVDFRIVKSNRFINYKGSKILTTTVYDLLTKCYLLSEQDE